MKLLASFKVQNVSDFVDSIGNDTFTNTTVQQLVDDPATPYVIESSNGGLYLSFGLEEDTSLSATFTNAISGQYSVDAKNHVVELYPKGILITTHPPHRPK